jgi:membrane associated rhomboid family serine protease
MKLCKADLLALTVIVLVPILCIIVFYLPLSIQLSLVAKGDTLDPVRYITTGFVHGNLSHLVNNLFGFLLFGLLVFGLNKIAGSQKFLFYALLWVILLVPLLYGFFVWAFSTIIFKGALSGDSFGLSLIAGAVMGLVVPSILNLFQAELEKKVYRAALFLGLLMLTGAFMIGSYLGSSLFWWTFFSIIAVSGSVLVCLVFFRINRYAEKSSNRRLIRKLSLAVLVMFFYLIFLTGLFPAEIVMPNLATVNIFAHYFGVSLGMLTGFYLVFYDKKK